MRVLRMLLAALAIAGVLANSAHASLGTNFSDQWWNSPAESESGWGASILQQADVMYIELYVYGPDNRPTWYAGALYLQPNSGRLLFTGDLYTYTGPWFGTGSFNPAFVTNRKVGTIAFDASSTDTATLTYSIDGTTYVKDIERQLFAYEDFTGSYYGGLVYDLSACADPAENGHIEDLGAFQITHPTDNTFRIDLQAASANCTIVGNYSQLGHMGTVDANYACSFSNGGGVNGTMTVFELERTGSGMTGRFEAQDVCRLSGRIGGVER